MTLPFKRLGGLGFVLSIALTPAYCFILWQRIPVLYGLEHWFWEFTFAPRPCWWLIFPLLMCVLGAAQVVRRPTVGAGTKAIVVLLTGFLVQQGYALMEGRGLDALKARMLDTGHAGFAEEAARQTSLLQVARHYEALIESGGLTAYPSATKPPGQLLFYMITERASRVLAPWESDGLERMSTFASVAYPLLTYIAIVPLIFLARPYCGNDGAFVSALIFLTLPNVTLINMHLDQCLYPLLFTTSLVLYLRGVGTGRRLLLALSGASAALAIFVSFSLLAIFALVVMCALLTCFCESTEATPLTPRKAGRHLARFILGFLLVEAALAVLLDYNLVESCRLALSKHQAWKVREWTYEETMYVGWLDLLEFATWAGLPICWLASAFMVRSCWRLWDGAGRGPHALGASTLAIFFLLAFTGRTVAETARLWIFLGPTLSLLAALELGNRFGQRKWQALNVLLVVQMLTALAIKMWQDFS